AILVQARLCRWCWNQKEKMLTWQNGLWAIESLCTQTCCVTEHCFFVGLTCRRWPILNSLRNLSVRRYTETMATCRVKNWVARSMAQHHILQTRQFSFITRAHTCIAGPC